MFAKVKTFAPFILVMMTMGCGAETRFSGGTGDAYNLQQTDKFTGGVSDGYAPVDITFVVDTSGSMVDEQAKLEKNMATFIDNFLQLSSKIDYQVFFVGKGFKFPDVVNSNSKVSLVDQYVGSFDALVRSVQFLKKEITGDLQPRENALQSLIFITDDESTYMSAAEFKQEIEALNYVSVQVNGFVGLPTSQTTQTCKVEKVGQQYINISKMPEFQGLIQDLCTDNWTPMLDDLAKSILQKVKTNAFKLTSSPDLSEGFKVFVSGQLIPESGYTYNANSNSIVFKKNYEPSAGAQIKIIYFKKYGQN